MNNVGKETARTTGGRATPAELQMHECETCGKSTSNPRFCGHSCAATTNNAEVPKRRPEGNCEKCGKMIPRRKKYCPDCQTAVEAEREEQERRRRENYQTWLTPTGETSEGPIPRVRVRTVFQPEMGGLSENLNGQSPARDLIDFLIGICFAGTPYLRKADAIRYISLLADLRAFFCRDWSTGVERKTRVAEICIDDLPRALGQWVDAYLDTYFEEGHHPMMPAYAMDAARFIELHAKGYDTVDWTVQPLLSTHRELRRWELFDSAFKRRFSTKFGPVVGCQVPDSGYRLSQANWIKPLGPGSRFLFRIDRCHLSEKWDGRFELIGSDVGLRYDLMEEFYFTGTLLLCRGSKNMWSTISPEKCPTSFAPIDGYRAGVGASVSGRWITHAIMWPDGKPHLEAVPRWTADGGEPESKNVQ